VGTVGKTGKELNKELTKAAAKEGIPLWPIVLM